MSFKSDLLFAFVLALATVAFDVVFIFSLPLFAMVDFSSLFAFSFALSFFCWPFAGTLELELFDGDGFFAVSVEDSLLLVATFDLFATLCDAALCFVLFTSLLTVDDFRSSPVLSDVFALFAFSFDLLGCCGVASFFGYINKINYYHSLLLIVNIWLRIIQDK